MFGVYMYTVKLMIKLEVENGDYMINIISIVYF